MIVGIIGSRRRNENEDKQLIENELIKLLNEFENIEICSGGCSRGGDRFAEELSKKYDLLIKIFPAKWEKFGKAAGFIRNTDIAKCSDILICCVSKDRKGGTEDTIRKFKKLHPGRRIILV